MKMHKTVKISIRIVSDDFSVEMREFKKLTVDDHLYDYYKLPISVLNSVLNHRPYDIHDILDDDKFLEFQIKWNKYIIYE